MVRRSAQNGTFDVKCTGRLLYAHGSFRRSDFGITYGVPAPGTAIGVGELIDFSIEAEFTGSLLAAAPEATH